jgi:glycerate kinase
MRILIAMDSFKGSLSSLQAGNAVKDAILFLNADATVTVRPLADGGEGTVDAMCCAGGTPVVVTVSDPLGRPTNAQYCIIGRTAVIEIAAAAGITLLQPEERDPYLTSTYGVGQLILDAIEKGCRHFIVGIGGSATNDGGTGMLSALGFRFLDTDGNPIFMGAKGLESLAEIDISGADPRLKECTFRIACDVTNPLCGENGCSVVFGPQKGATADVIGNMDLWLQKYAQLAAHVSDCADPNYPGCGAAGGLGFAFRTFLQGSLQSGAQIIFEETELEKYIENCDIVVTGEGCLDGQTVMGKAPIGVARLAKRYGKKVIAFAGCVTEDAVACNAHGIDAFFPIVPGAVTLQEAMKPENAYRNLKHTACQVFRLIME